MSQFRELKSSLVRTLTAKDMQANRYLITSRIIENHKIVQRPVAVIIPYDQYYLMRLKDGTKL